MSWIVSLPCTRDEAEALSQEIPELDAMADAPVVVTREIDEDAGLWQLDAYMDDRPGAALLTLLPSLVPRAQGPEPIVAELPEAAWVTRWPPGAKPVREGRLLLPPHHETG